VRSAIAGIGRTLVTLGLLILLFVVYQLWGTGIFTARAQENLKNKFDQQLEATDDPVIGTASTTSVPGSAVTTPTVPHDRVKPPPPIPPEGEVEGTISIQRIGLDMAFVEGTSRDDLKKGPGHYPGTPVPGTIGNAAIAGHRTTYLHPFGDLDKLLPGDLIVIRTLAGSFVYRVSQPWFKVKATDVWVVDNTLDPQLTLTACHPKHSAEFRIVIKAKLVVNKSSRVTRPSKPVTVAGSATHQDALQESLSGQTKSLAPSVFFGFIAAVVGLAWWWAFRRWRIPRTWLIGVLFFLVALFPFYVYLERALPSGY
jgi:sortase A